MEKKIIIRNEEEKDIRAVDLITREAFWNHYGPGCREHCAIQKLRQSEAFIHELDFVALIEDKIVGNIVYSYAKIIGDDGREYSVATFGPLSVLPQNQKQGIGAKLINISINRAKELGIDAVLIFGDPDYYSKFGFVKAEKYDIGTQDNMYADALLAIELREGALDGASGRFVVDPVNFVSEEELIECEKAYPPKEKIEGTPSQKKFIQLLGRMRPRR